MHESTSEAPSLAGAQPDAEPLPGSARCPGCGQSVPTTANFCPYCGSAAAGGPDRLVRGGEVPWTLLDLGKAIGFIVAGVLVSLVPLAIAIYLVAGSDPDENDATYLTVTIGSSVVLQILMLIAAIRFGAAKYHLSWSSLGLRRMGRGGYWLPIPLVFSAYGIMVAYLVVLDAFGVQPDSDLPEGTFDNLGPIIAVGVLSLVFAPFAEEVFFRGYIFGGLRARWRPMAGALGSGLLFGAVHAANPGSFYIVPPIALIGAMFAWAYIYSGSIFAGIGAHFLFNLTSFVIGLTTE